MTLDFTDQRACGWQHQGNKILIPNKYRIFSPIFDVNGSARVCVDTVFITGARPGTRGPGWLIVTQGRASTDLGIFVKTKRRVYLSSELKTSLSLSVLIFQHPTQMTDIGAFIGLGFCS